MVALADAIIHIIEIIQNALNARFDELQYISYGALQLKASDFAKSCIDFAFNRNLVASELWESLKTRDRSSCDMYFDSDDNTWIQPKGSLSFEAAALGVRQVVCDEVKEWAEKWMKHFILPSVFALLLVYASANLPLLQFA